MNELEEIGLKKLQEAFKKVNSMELDSLNIPNEDFEFSEKYKKNMAKLLKKHRKPSYRYFNTAGKRAVACILVCIMIIASSVTIAAFHEPVAEFFVNVYEKFVEIFFGDDYAANSPSEIETVYTLGYLPEGYEFESREVIGNLVKTVYVNGTIEMRLTQNILNANALLDYENADFTIQTENGMKIAVIEKFGNRYLYWASNEYAYKLSVPNYFSNEECILIVESLIELK